MSIMSSDIFILFDQRGWVNVGRIEISPAMHPKTSISDIIANSVFLPAMRQFFPLGNVTVSIYSKLNRPIGRSFTSPLRPEGSGAQ